MKRTKRIIWAEMVLFFAVCIGWLLGVTALACTFRPHEFGYWTCLVLGTSWGWWGPEIFNRYFP